MYPNMLAVDGWWLAQRLGTWREARLKPSMLTAQFWRYDGTFAHQDISPKAPITPDMCETQTCVIHKHTQVACPASEKLCDTDGVLSCSFGGTCGVEASAAPAAATPAAPVEVGAFPAWLAWVHFTRQSPCIHSCNDLAIAMPIYSPHTASRS